LHVKLTTLFVGDEASAGHIDANGTSARFQDIKSLTISDTGTLFIYDIVDKIVRRIDTDGMVTTIAGQLKASGYLDGVYLWMRF